MATIRFTKTVGGIYYTIDNGSHFLIGNEPLTITANSSTNSVVLNFDDKDHPILATHTFYVNGIVLTGTVTQKADFLYNYLVANGLFRQTEPVPSAPTAAAGSSGTNLLSAGAYKWKVTCITADGETEASAEGTGLTNDPTATLPPVVTIPKGSPNCTSRRIYRTLAGGVIFKLSGTVSNNTATTYTDNVADGSLTTVAPVENTAINTARVVHIPVTTLPKVYRVLISQSSTSAPTVVEMENGIGNIVWTRNAAGDYRGSLTGAFPSGKTWFSITPQGTDSSAPAYLAFSRIDANTVVIGTGAPGSANSDGWLNNTSASILVYP